jgi:hypothetical protein
MRRTAWISLHVRCHLARSTPATDEADGRFGLHFSSQGDEKRLSARDWTISKRAEAWV